MSKKLFCFALCATLFALCFPAEAQQAGKVYRIGVLRFRKGSPTLQPGNIAFRQGMRELGYVEGQNFVMEYRSAKGEEERLPEVTAELVRLKVDVILISGSSFLIRAAQRATSTIPIILAGVHVDPAEAGFVVSLARPGSNITGLTNLAAQLHPKQVELLKEAFPRISRVALLWPRAHKKSAMKKVEAVGQALGIQIQSVVASRSSGGIASAFSAISRERPNGLLVVSFGFTLRHRARIIDFAAKRQLPTIYDRNIFVDAGGLMSYNADRKDLVRRVATYVDKILKGAKPGDLPVEQPTKFELIINLKTAKALGLTIPPEVLIQATKVIK